MIALVSTGPAVELGTLEIRPRLVRLLAVLLAGVALFVGGGAYIALAADGAERLVGIVSIVFGLWAVIAWGQRLRSRAAIVLSPRGLRTAVGGEIPWADIAEVGTVRYRGTTLVGLRLRSAERFAASFTEPERAALERKVRQLHVISRGVSTAQLATINPVQPDDSETLGDDSLASIAGMIAFSRANYEGFDWTIGAIELDRPAAEFVALLNDYRARA